MLHRQKRRYGLILTGCMMVLLLLVILAAAVLLLGGRAEAVSLEASETGKAETFGEAVPEMPMEVLIPEDTSVEESGYVFVLDAGHGFGDPGCVSDFMDGTEAEVALEITMLLGEKLRALGAQVYLTHDGDNYPSPEKLKRLLEETDVSYMPERLIADEEYSPYERCMYTSYINSQEPITLFLSLHVNSLPESPEVSQRELYYWEGNPQAEMLKRLTDVLTEQYEGVTKTEASTYDEAFIVTKYVTYPALLMELGYSTNPEDAEKLNDALWRENFCENLAHTLLAWAEGE